jgi:hypothetical protein
MSRVPDRGRHQIEPAGKARRSDQVPGDKIAALVFRRLPAAGRLSSSKDIRFHGVAAGFASRRRF